MKSSQDLIKDISEVVKRELGEDIFVLVHYDWTYANIPECETLGFAKNYEAAIKAAASIIEGWQEKFFEEDVLVQKSDNGHTRLLPNSESLEGIWIERIDLGTISSILRFSVLEHKTYKMKSELQANRNWKTVRSL